MLCLVILLGGLLFPLGRGVDVEESEGVCVGGVRRGGRRNCRPDVIVEKIIIMKIHLWKKSFFYILQLCVSVFSLLSSLTSL